MPGSSSITAPVAARVPHSTLERLQELARERGTTVSVVLASIAQDGIRRIAA